MGYVRALFDGLLEDYPQLEHYLDLNGIAHSSRFEESLAKASEGARLTTAEKGCLHMFAQDVVQTVSGSGEASYAQMVLARKRQRQDENGLTNVNWVCPTSNLLERQFCEVKHMYPQSRKSALPKNREAQVFLQTNERFWGVRDVDAII